MEESVGQQKHAGSGIEGGILGELKDHIVALVKPREQNQGENQPKAEFRRPPEQQICNGGQRDIGDQHRQQDIPVGHISGHPVQKGKKAAEDDINKDDVLAPFVSIDVCQKIADVAVVIRAELHGAEHDRQDQQAEIQQDCGEERFVPLEKSCIRSAQETTSFSRRTWTPDLRFQLRRCRRRAILARARSGDGESV